MREEVWEVRQDLVARQKLSASDLSLAIADAGIAPEVSKSYAQAPAPRNARPRRPYPYVGIAIGKG